MLYAIHAVVNIDTYEGTITKQLPTFFLDSHIQGFMGESGAEKIAVRMLNDMGVENMSVAAFKITNDMVAF